MAMKINGVSFLFWRRNFAWQNFPPTKATQRQMQKLDYKLRLEAKVSPKTLISNNCLKKNIFRQSFYGDQYIFTVMKFRLYSGHMVQNNNCWDARFSCQTQITLGCKVFCARLDMACTTRLTSTFPFSPVLCNVAPSHCSVFFSTSTEIVSFPNWCCSLTGAAITIFQIKLPQ